MKLVCTQENLAKGLQTVSRVATTRSSLPILANILVATDGGRLKLAATDLEVGVTTWIGAKVSGEGSVTLPARLFVDFVTSNTDETLELSVSGYEATVKSPHYNATLNGMDANDFPLIPPPGKDEVAVVPAATLRRALQGTLYAAAVDDTRPVLNGVFLKVEGTTLTLAATDSYRLAERRIELTKGPKELVTLILPARAAAELVRILPETEDEVALTLSANQLSLAVQDTQVVSRLIEGVYPDYTQIIPKEIGTSVTLARAELAAAVKMSSLFARDSAGHIRLKFLPDKGLDIEAVSPSAGKNTATIQAEVTGEALEVAFNAKYVLDALNALTAPQVVLSSTGVDRPGILRPVGDDTSLALVMPLRLDA
ncbi:MAG: DNA polymerase III subunit beta [Patescibacteria group bacterium]|jgi:DNA polymerase-3 subunit beta